MAPPEPPGHDAEAPPVLDPAALVDDPPEEVEADDLGEPGEFADTRPRAEALVAASLSFFGPDSPLRDAPRHGGRQYEERPQQSHMAEFIARHLAAGAHCCIEAPTGVGKSFAYLVPAIHYAKATGKPVVVSTHTIALQEQLLHKDIPLLKQLLPVPFSAALAKGRENYLCLNRLQKVLADQTSYLPSLDLMPEIEKLRRWAAETTDGSRADLDFNPSPGTWASVCAEGGSCARERGQADEGCFLEKARRRLHKADVIVSNHAFFCADLALRRDSGGEQHLLPDYSAVIIDEAHTFEDVAANHLGIRLSTAGAMMMLSRLLNPRTGRGLLSHPGTDEARQKLTEAYDATRRFFSAMLEWLEAQDENPLPFESPGHIPNLIDDSWSALIRELKALATRHEQFDEEYRQDVRSIAQRLDDWRKKLEIFLTCREEGCVYFFERSGRQQQQVTFNGLPIAVQPVLRPLLFEGLHTAVMTSATLAVGGSLDYFRDRLGCPEADGDILDSPFDFEQQVGLWLPPRDMPAPNHPNYLGVAEHCLRQSLRVTEGKAFVLFTSYRTMNAVAADLEDFFEEQGWQLLVQGRDLQRSQMIAAFKEDVNSVIFGTDSFWTGVDVPGEALSSVVIMKLPFPVPSHPLVEARCRRLEEAGRSSFRDFSLPEAVLKLRQGVGRLIRSRADSGIITILDRRILYSSYGRVFLDSLPRCRRHEIAL